jgi:outer membrane biogenesis lipoprotein LolB
MLERLGPSSLLRLAAVITLGASLLLSGCAASTHESPQTAAEEKEGWSRCEHGRPGMITFVCWKR